ncbi:MAG: PQQ-binding-like beta-propeller repeat protein [Anaerolineales bacterium]|nr:PQQ-binding-like beta-propeller repeat protein [Anaerolineales bacterium]
MVKLLIAKIARLLLLGLALVGCFVQPATASAVPGITPVSVPVLTPTVAGNNPTRASATASTAPIPPPTDYPTLTADATTVFLPVLTLAPEPPPALDSWPTVAANPQRTSWTPEEVSGNLNVEWYRPIEAYIPQNVQLIASDGLIFVSTARGLYALDAATGAVAWRFDTELPLGNSPTVSDGVVYVGGYDRKLHALRAADGAHLWSFDGARAGYSTNPLVVDGRVFVGNRDGWMYAIGAHGTPQQGQLLWQYQTDGLISLAAAYQDGVVYFASNDNHAYALAASSGALVWRSELLPGDGYESYWPVVYRDKVIFAAASGYRHSGIPGGSGLTDEDGDPYGSVFHAQRENLFYGQPDGAIIGPQVADQPWAHGKPILDGSRITEYLEANPNPDFNLHKPYRRVMIVLNRGDGREYTFDSDGDGNAEYMPAGLWATRSGNRYPAIVGPDDTLYFSNVWQRFFILQGKVMGWLMGTPFLSVVGGQGAVDEPNAISAGGNLIYRTICCDRVGDWFAIDSNRHGELWHYGERLTALAPGYDVMWYGVEPDFMARLRGNYGTQNGIYHSHGDQNPIIPYNGRLYVHRSNAVIAFGPGSGPGHLPLLASAPAASSSAPVSTATLQSWLEAAVTRMLQAGHLRPGYYNAGQFFFEGLVNYFENPGDTLYTLTRAYPHLSPQAQQQTQAYLRAEFQAYFDPTMYARIGWQDGAAREAMPLPPEIDAARAKYAKALQAGSDFSWSYPPHNFYAMWKYAEIFPADAGQVYNLAKSKLVVPVPSMATDPYLIQRPFEANAYIAGYLGFLNLQALAGQAATDAALRATVTAEYDRLLTLRATTFSKDTPYVGDYSVPPGYHPRVLNISRNFIFLVPELGAYLAQNALGPVTAALAEYNSTAPYWFVARYNAAVNEGARQNLYDYPAIFQAKAFILHESRAELTKYLDVPAFQRGDLFYIQNLVAALEAP